MLAQWLTQHRARLLPEWTARLHLATSRPAAASYTNGHSDTSNAGVAHPQERDLLMASLYDGIVLAAHGDLAPLDQCLRLMRALRSSDDDDELRERLELAFQLRRVIWEGLFADPALEAQRRQLLEAAEQMFEHVTLAMTEHWTASAAFIRQQLEHSEQFAQTLAQSAEQADQIALQLHNLNTLAAELATSLDVEALIATAGSKLNEVLGVAHVAIWLTDAHGTWAVAQSWGQPDHTGLQLADQQPDPLITQAVQQRALLRAPLDGAATAHSWRLADSAALIVPLLAQNLPLGVITVQDPDPEIKLGPSQQDFVSSVASQLAIAIENARLLAEVRGFNAALEQRIAERTHELQIERDMLSTLNQIALEINSTLDLDLLLTSSLQVFANLVGVERGSIMLIEEDTNHLVDRAVLGRARDQVGYTRFPIGHGIAGWVAQHRKPALVPDVNQDERWVELPETELGRKQLGSMALVPLTVQGEVTGVMSLSHDQIGYFNEDHMRLLAASAETIALGINNARLYDEISRESVRRGDMVQKERSATTQSSAILQSLSDGVIVCNEDGGVITANPAAERVLGIPLEDLLLLPLPDLLRKLLLHRAKEVPIEATLEGRSAVQSYSIDFLRGRYTIRVTLDPVVTERGQTIGALAVFRDITREVESERLKDEFIGTVSHELRTPMTSIKGFTQLLAMGSLGPINAQQKEFLGTIQTNAERMISIINDLLDITKIEAGSVELEIRPVHVAEALGNVMMEVRPQIALRQHELQIIIPPGLPLVRVDAKRFDQVLGHLLTNAIKYTPNGGKITIAASELDHATLPPAVAERLVPGRYVQVDVADSGVGIAAEEQELVFHRFYRTENPLKIEAGGTGLGLSLVRPLIKLFGGQVWLHSFIGEGSTFSFVVPAV